MLIELLQTIQVINSRHKVTKEPLKNVSEAASARQKLEELAASAALFSFNFGLLFSFFDPDFMSLFNQFILFS